MRGGLDFLCVKWGKKMLIAMKAFEKRPNTIEAYKLLPRELKSLKSISKLLSKKLVGGFHMSTFAKIDESILF